MAGTMQSLDKELLQQLLDDDNFGTDIVIIDIREPDEYAREHIASSINIPSSKLCDFDLSTIKASRAIFHCKMGHRTKACEPMIIKSHFDAIYCLDGGIEQWKQLGFDTETDKKAPMELMRQVQIIAGSLVVTGAVLSYLLNPQFILLSGFVGAGLLLAGITGWCGMAKLLKFMPWNK